MKAYAKPSRYFRSTAKLKPEKLGAHRIIDVPEFATVPVSARH
jgi:hypothetical protein